MPARRPGKRKVSRSAARVASVSRARASKRVPRFSVADYERGIERLHTLKRLVTEALSHGPENAYTCHELLQNALLLEARLAEEHQGKVLGAGIVRDLQGLVRQLDDALVRRRPVAGFFPEIQQKVQDIDRLIEQSTRALQRQYNPVGSATRVSRSPARASHHNQSRSPSLAA